MKKALFPGSFDPPTLGHVDILKRSASVCDKLYVGIAVNSTKRQDLFTPEEKIQMLKTIASPFPHVEVVSFTGLVVEYAKQHNIDFLLRGLRAFSDFEYEFRMALTNRTISGIETLFLMSDERTTHISSTLIRELARYKSRLHQFVPEEIENEVFQRLSSSK
jgi:pantetheine-phosphate adenylyltransferase